MPGQNLGWGQNRGQKWGQANFGARPGFIVCQGCLVPRLVEIRSLDLEKNEFKCQQCIFSIISPSKKGVAPHLYKLELPLPKNVLYQIWLKLALWFWERRFLNVDNLFFLLFHYHLPLEKGVTFHLIKSTCKSYSCLHPSFILSFVVIGSSVSGKEFKKVNNFLYNISLLSLLGKGPVPHLCLLESPSPKDVLCQVW